MGSETSRRVQEGGVVNLILLERTKQYPEALLLLIGITKWTCIKPKHSDLFAKNDINDFLLEEEKGILWIALNAVGLIRYDIVQDKWEIYTPENSAVPSIHVMDLTKDKDGLIWASTFAGIIKMKK